MGSNIPVVEAVEVSKSYGREVMTWALRGVDIKVDAGEFIAIVGASGSGKSTLLNLIGALDRPSAGSILIDGRDTAHMRDEELAALRGDTIGFIFQFHYLLNEFSIMENALIPLSIRKGGATSDDIKWVKKLFKKVGLDHKLNSKPKQLSGGQQQRAAIVRSLANRPKLILADEPTGNLDSQNGAMVFDLLRELNESMGTAFILVTHDDRMARQAQRVVAMEDGNVAADYHLDESVEDSVPDYREWRQR